MIKKFPSDSFILGGYVSSKVCNEIIDHYKKNKHKTHEGEVGTKGVDHKSKISKELIYSHVDFFNMFPQYAEELSKILKIYLKKYFYADRVNKFSVLDNIKIQYYKPNEGYFVWHFENNGNIFTIQRHLVFMTYLNDVKDGGTEFFYQKIKTKAEKGLTLIWPAHWTHTHRGIVSKTKEKYITTGWFDFSKE
jgi:hypothetical protein